VIKVRARYRKGITFYLITDITINDFEQSLKCKLNDCSNICNAG